MTRALLLAVLLSAPLSAEEGRPDFVDQVYLTPAQALEKSFPGETVGTEAVRLTPAQKARVEGRLGWRLERDDYEVHRAPSGTAVIVEEIGKHKPITFLVKVTPAGAVERVEVLVYREPRGGEVRKPRFLRQLKGKTAGSPLRINRDVVNVTGATLSVRAMAAGVKRVLCILEEVYGPR